MIGLTITAIIMAALATMMTAVASGWTDQNLTQSTQLQANQVYARIQKTLASAKYFVPSSGTSTASYIIFWRLDGYPNGATSDGIPEWGEIGMIIQDPTTSSLLLYQTTLPCANVLAATQLTWTQMQALTPATIEGWPFIQKTVLGGPGSSTSNSGFRVTAATFYANSNWLSNQGTTSQAAQLPVVEVTLTCARNGQSMTLYNTSTLRSPTTQPTP